MDASVIFAAVAGIIIIGFAGEFFFKKTSIPIFIFLILTGIILGPILNIFPRQSLISVIATIRGADISNGSVFRWIRLEVHRGSRKWGKGVDSSYSLCRVKRHPDWNDRNFRHEMGHIVLLHFRFDGIR